MPKVRGVTGTLDDVSQPIHTAELGDLLLGEKQMWSHRPLLLGGCLVGQTQRREKREQSDGLKNYMHHKSDFFNRHSPLKLSLEPIHARSAAIVTRYPSPPYLTGGNFRLFFPTATWRINLTINVYTRVNVDTQAATVLQLMAPPKSTQAKGRIANTYVRSIDSTVVWFAHSFAQTLDYRKHC